MDERTTSGESTGPPVPGPDESVVPAGVQPGVREAGSGEAVTEEALQADVARLTEEAQRNWEQFLRTAADLENYRKQAVRQREEAVSATRRAMLHVILGVVDTLERAVQHGARAGGTENNAAAILDGIRLAQRQVLDTLKTMGVRPMDAIGQPFDPRVHEAVDAVPAAGDAVPGTIVGEIQRGYMIGDDVLRAARVRVAQ